MRECTSTLQLGRAEAMEVAEDSLGEYLQIKEEPYDGETEEDEDVSRAKKRKVQSRLTLSQEEGLCKWFSEKPLFYDQTLIDFKNKSKRDRILDNKAREYGLAG